jgi:glycosyltransferase involved in cell wall biosynthesis
MRDRIPEIHLDIVGEGEYRPRLEELADRLSLRRHVTFAGFLPSYDQVAPILKDADLGVVALRTDHQLCTKLLEYLALGIPAITTESAALRPYLDDTEVRYVQPNNSRALADAIMELYLDRKRLAALARNGYAAYRQHFAWDIAKRDYVAIYESHAQHFSELHAAC